jgi:tetratricopeptide (TPR) repeat protein
LRDNKKIENSLIPIGSTSLIRVVNSISITNKLVERENEIESLFNKAYILIFNRFNTKIIENDFYNTIIKNPGIIDKQYCFFEGNADNPENYNLAIACLLEIIKIKPSFIFSYYFRGIAYENIGEYDLALKDYSIFIKMSKNTTLGYKKRAFLNYYQFGNAKKAIKDCNAALILNKNDDKCLEILVLISEHLLEDSEMVLKYTNRLLEINPNNIDCLHRRAAFYLEEEDYLNAIKDSDCAIKLEPNNVGLFNFKGLLYAAQNDYNTSIINFTYAINNWHNGIENSISVSHIYKQRSDSYKKIGNKIESQKDQTLYEKWKNYLPF